MDSTRTPGPTDAACSAVSSVHPFAMTITSNSSAFAPDVSCVSRRPTTAASLCAGITMLVTTDNYFCRVRPVQACWRSLVTACAAPRRPSGLPATACPLGHRLRSRRFALDSAGSSRIWSGRRTTSAGRGRFAPPAGRYRMFNIVPAFTSHKCLRAVSSA
jgi:hypothetical protein